MPRPAGSRPAGGSLLDSSGSLTTFVRAGDARSSLGDSVRSLLNFGRAPTATRAATEGPPMAEHITIGDVAPRVQYVADGVLADFTFPFPIFAR